MGTLIYDSTLRTDFDDRLLAHLQWVIGSKLRRAESFFVSWPKDPAMGGGRTTIWIHPHIPLGFDYADREVQALSDDWLVALEESSSSESGLSLRADPSAPDMPAHATRQTLFN